MILHRVVILPTSDYVIPKLAIEALHDEGAITILINSVSNQTSVGKLNPSSK
jgi:hypothetical protein